MAPKKPAAKKKAAAKKPAAKKVASNKAPKGADITSQSVEMPAMGANSKITAKEFGYNPLGMLKEFLHMEASGGMILLFFAVLAMIIANSPVGDTYYHFLHHTNLIMKIGEFGIDKDIIHWINDGLMAIFFFLVGLEIKREMMEGALSSFKKAALPAFAAIGGMAIPGIVYVMFNMHAPDGTLDFSNPAMKGWAIPAATDIAFAVGLMSLLGTRVPLALKVFLLALAIFDDLGAIIIIALFYTSNLAVANLFYAAFFIAGLILLNRMNVSKGSWYLVLGICLWFCVLKSGVHATLAGVIIALCIPLQTPGERRSLLRQLEHDLHPFVAFAVLPIFAFANAGVSLEGISWEVMTDQVTLGVIFGLVFGKQIGVLFFTWLAKVLRIATLPKEISWTQVWGVSCMAGVGFTMSLFIAGLGFRGYELYLTEAKLGILTGSFISAIMGLMILNFACPKKPKN